MNIPPLESVAFFCAACPFWHYHLAALYDHWAQRHQTEGWGQVDQGELAHPPKERINPTRW
tara:strand:+ start:1774 stop:1956 length:183 start_codon:yes stop_codon:yes gene_type:complete